jgi:hypothetical protein
MTQKWNIPLCPDELRNVGPKQEEREYSDSVFSRCGMWGIVLIVDSP